MRNDSVYRQKGKADSARLNLVHLYGARDVFVTLRRQSHEMIWARISGVVDIAYRVELHRVCAEFGEVLVLHFLKK